MRTDNKWYLLIGTFVILNTIATHPAFSGECDNFKKLWKKTFVTGISEFSFKESRPINEQKSGKQKSDEQKRNQLDEELKKVNNLKADFAKTNTQLSSLKKKLEKIKQDPLMKLHEFSLCALRYQNVYDKEKRPSSPNAGTELEALSNEDSDFSVAYEHKTYVIQKIADKIYDPSYELHKHSAAYRAADCILISGDKLIKTVLNSTKLNKDVRTGYLENLGDASVDYRDLKYYKYANKLSAISNKLLDVYNKQKFTELTERRRKIVKSIASLQASRSDLRAQYNLKIDAISSKLGTVTETVKTMNKEFGLEVSPKCLANISSFCSIRGGNSDSICE